MNNIKIIDNLEIINDSICKKKIKSNNTNLYKYLKSKEFYNFIDSKVVNGYEIREFVEEIPLTKEEKLNELIYIITMLHTKTTHYKEIKINDIKVFYEKITDEINDIKNYYNELFDNNSIFLFLKPSINLLIDKIYIIFTSLDNCKYFLDKWYDIVKIKKRKRVVVNHNNLKLSNFIYGKEEYLINFDNLKIDYPIYDLVSIFKNNYKIIDMIDLYDIYSAKYKLYLEEEYLLYVFLLKIDKIDFNDNEILNTRKVNETIDYLNKVVVFLENCMKNKK